MRLGGRWVGGVGLGGSERGSERNSVLCIVSQFANSSKATLCVRKTCVIDYLDILRMCKHTCKWCLGQLLPRCLVCQLLWV